MAIAERSLWLRVLAGFGLVVSLAASVFFGSRALDSYTLLRSATEFGLPTVATIRPWMTLGYVAATYDAPYADLTGELGLPSETPEATTLGSISQSRREPPLAFVLEVQEAVAAIATTHMEDDGDEPEVSEERSDDYLSALLAYRYPALALVLLVGAIGVPVPTGFTTLLAGSLVALGEMTWPVVAAIAIGASVAGDVVGYAIGRLADESFLTRFGRWVGYSGKNRARIQQLFDDWGGLTILISRTLASHLSSLASLPAGITRYPFEAFVAYAAAGRVIWTAAYLGLGYFIGNSIEAAGTFLEHVSGLILALGVALISASYLFAPYIARPEAVSDPQAEK